jgi:hypothetical protein
MVIRQPGHVRGLEEEIGATAVPEDENDIALACELEIEVLTGWRGQRRELAQVDAAQRARRGGARLLQIAAIRSIAVATDASTVSKKT